MEALKRLNYLGTDKHEFQNCFVSAVLHCFIMVVYDHYAHELEEIAEWKEMDTLHSSEDL